MTIGMGPIGVELGGHQIAVEVARNHLRFCLYTPLAQRSRALRYERRFVGGSNPSRRARRVPVDGKGLTKRRANGW